MAFLLLDTADARGCVALFRVGRTALVEPHPAGFDYSDWLLPAVHRVLRQAGLSFSDLDAFAVCSGPGSFTGLRVGLTTVKAWAEILPKPILSVSRLEALGEGAEVDQKKESFVAAFLDAGRAQVFATLLDLRKYAVQPECVMSLADFLDLVQETCGSAPVLWHTPDPDLLEAVPQWRLRQSVGDTLTRVVPPFAAQLVACARRKFERGEVTDAISLDADYVRRSDAELFWKDHASAVKV